MDCPKCAAPSPSVRRAEPPASMADGWRDWDTPERIFGRMADPLRPYAHGVDMEEMFECPVHGEFGVGPDGRPAFVEPDTWVEGPNGEKLFRT